MTLNATPNSYSADGNGVTTVFTLPFQIQSAADLYVNAVDIATGGELGPYYVNQDFTLSGIGSANTTLTLTSPLAVGVRLKAWRDPANDQPTSYTPGDPFPAKTHEAALDHLAMQIARLKDRVDRMAYIPDLSTGSVTGAPAPVEGSVLGWVAGRWQWLLAAATDLSAALLGTGVSQGDALIKVVQPLLGATSRTQHDKNSDTVSILDFAGGTPDGTTSNVSAINNASTSGKTIVFPAGVFVIDGPVTVAVPIVGDGCGRTIFKITSASGGFTTAAWCMRWSGFTITSAVANSTMINVHDSYFKLHDVRLDTQGSPANVTGIKFDCTTRDIYFCDIDNIKTQNVAHPISVVGPSATTYHSWNANRIGSSYKDDFQDCTQAVALSGAYLIAVANEFNGYVENTTGDVVGVRTTGLAAGKFRQNVIRFILDATAGSTYALAADTAINGANWWWVHTNEFGASPAGNLGYNNVFMNNKARFKVRLSGDQTINDNLFTKVSMATADWNLGGAVDANGVPAGSFDTTLYKFTAKNKMLARFTAQLEVVTNLPSSSKFRLAFYKNEAYYSGSQLYAPTANGARPAHSDTLQLAAGDTVTLYILADDPGGTGSHVVAAGQDSFFNGEEL